MSWRQRWRRWTRPAWFGTLRRTTPVSRGWGAQRGTPIDRYYIERFLAANRKDIRGRVLEVKDSAYTTQFGTAVTRSDVLDVAADNPAATIVADLAAADAIPSASFDCFILTQTLPLIYDVRSAVAHARRILKPGGVLLATVPSTLPTIGRHELDPDYWRFTVAACHKIFGEAFGPDHIEVTGAGNVLASVAFLHGLAAEELKKHELESYDHRIPLVVTIRATRKN